MLRGDYEPMNLKSELTFENLVALERDAMKTIDKPRRRIITLKVFTVLLFIGILFIINPSLGLFDIAINVVATVIFVLVFPIIINKAAERTVRKSDNRKGLGSFSLQLSEEGIEIQRENSSKQVAWAEFSQVTSDNENFFLSYIMTSYS